MTDAVMLATGAGGVVKAVAGRLGGKEAAAAILRAAGIQSAKKEGMAAERQAIAKKLEQHVRGSRAFSKSAREAREAGLDARVRAELAVKTKRADLGEAIVAQPGTPLPPGLELPLFLYRHGDITWDYAKVLIERARTDPEGMYRKLLGVLKRSSG